MHERPPVVAVLGHVDHGKTTLLDYIRKTSVAAREAGGITQAIGAYETTHNGKRITFIDTPGHEAFSNMRAHGARVADLAILVVAADDSVKPQTLDALKHLNEAKLPFIVAINKMDKPGADVEKTKKDLSQNGVYLEGYGGNVSWHPISAKTGDGVSDLLDLVLLASEMEGLTYDPAAPAAGAVLSARLDPKRGVQVGIILENGTLTTGQWIATASASGKVKLLEDFTGKRAAALIPSAPALIVGFEKLPKLGEPFFAGADAAVMKALAMAAVAPAARAEKPKEGELEILIKADEAASLEALEDLIQKIAASESATIGVLSASVGDIHETDIKGAEMGTGLVVGFRVKADGAAQNLAQARHITLLLSPIIYELEDAIRKYVRGAIVRERRAIEILAVFGTPKGKERVVGGRVVLGPVRNQEAFEIWQDKRLIGAGRILNLQSGRKDVAEAAAGVEAGLLVESEAPIKVGYRLVFS